MAVPAHFFARRATAPPATGMRVPAIASDPVATNAVRGGPLFVTARAQEDVPARFAPMLAADRRIISDPPEGMRARRPYPVRAHSPLYVARVARRWLVTARAAGRLRLRFNGVPREEVAAVLKSALDALRTSSLDRNTLRHVVTIVAVRFFVTRAT